MNKYQVQRQIQFFVKSNMNDDSQWEKHSVSFATRREALEYLANECFYDAGFYFFYRVLDGGKPVLMIKGNS